MATTLTDTRDFADPARRSIVDDTAAALASRGFDVAVAGSRSEARRFVLDRIPDGSEVHSGSSVTLQELGVLDEIEGSGRYNALRPRMFEMDRATQAREIRKLTGTPDVFLASAHALTRDGRLLVASASGSQMGPISSGAGRVILVVGTQKIVENLDEAYRRLEEHVLPLENERAMVAYGMSSSINQTLTLNSGGQGRISVVLVPEAIGF
jgi:hypothetical protein